MHILNLYNHKFSPIGLKTHGPKNIATYRGIQIRLWILEFCPLYHKLPTYKTFEMLMVKKRQQNI
jgi:hypothetical protein